MRSVVPYNYMVFSILLLLLGFVLLIGGAHVLVTMCVLVARTLSVPPVVIGMTVIAFGTSLPEFIVGLSASISGENVIVFGNVVGSNILNVFVMLGLCALIYPCAVSRQSMRIDIPLALLAALLMLVLPVLAMPFEHQKGTDNMLYFSRIDGTILFFVFVCFMVYMMRGLLRSEAEHDALEQQQGRRFSTVQSIGVIVLALGALIGGGRIIISSAVELAALLNVSKRIISIVVVALGTSLPELAVSVASAWKKHSDLALGNIVGSNIFNVFFILGTCVLISPIKVETSAMLDILVHILSISLLAVLTWTNKTHTVSRTAGFIFLLLYALYMLHLL